MKTPSIIKALTIFFAAASSSGALSQMTTASAERSDPRDSSSSILINWKTKSSGAVSIYVSTNPDATIAESELVAEGITANSYEAAGFSSQRVFFIIVPDASSPVRVAARLLPLEGGRNFRDIGGYQTKNGQYVKWGQVYRSGVMNDISDADYQLLDQLDIGTIIDFRSTQERASEPTDWRVDSPKLFSRDYTDEGSAQLMDRLFAADATPAKMKQQMASLYFDIVLQHSAAYAVMFNDLAEKNEPLLYNCSAGKDRTGVATALILTLLEVPREDIVYDYSLSDDYVDFISEFTSESAQVNDAYSYLSQVPVELLEPLMASHPEYIESALDYLEKEYGSVMNYIRSELSVSDAEITAIRSRLLGSVN
jgi:protein-tyrosine phosphatase